MKVCGSRAKALQTHLFQRFMDFHIVLRIRPMGLLVVASTSSHSKSQPNIPCGYWWWHAHHPTVSLSQTSPVVTGGGMHIILL